MSEEREPLTLKQRIMNILEDYAISIDCGQYEKAADFLMLHVRAYGEQVKLEHLAILREHLAHCCNTIGAQGIQCHEADIKMIEDAPLPEPK